MLRLLAALKLRRMQRESRSSGLVFSIHTHTHIHTTRGLQFIRIRAGDGVAMRALQVGVQRSVQHERCSKNSSIGLSKGPIISTLFLYEDGCLDCVRTSAQLFGTLLRRLFYDYPKARRSSPATFHINHAILLPVYKGLSSHSRAPVSDELLLFCITLSKPLLAFSD